jgi:hypothetical protein
MHLRFIWTPEIEEHLAEHGVTVDDYEYAFANWTEHTLSESTGLPAFSGIAPDGRELFGVYERLNDFEAIPVTAYFPEAR